MLPVKYNESVQEAFEDSFFQKGKLTPLTNFFIIIFFSIQ